MSLSEVLEEFRSQFVFNITIQCLVGIIGGLIILVFTESFIWGLISGIVIFLGISFLWIVITLRSCTDQTKSEEEKPEKKQVSQEPVIS